MQDIMTLLLLLCHYSFEKLYMPQKLKSHFSFIGVPTALLCSISYAEMNQYYSQHDLKEAQRRLSGYCWREFILVQLKFAFPSRPISFFKTTTFVFLLMCIAGVFEQPIESRENIRFILSWTDFLEPWYNGPIFWRIKRSSIHWLLLFT